MAHRNQQILFLLLAVFSASEEMFRHSAFIHPAYVVNVDSVEVLKTSRQVLVQLSLIGERT